MVNRWAAAINAAIDGLSASDPSGKAFSFWESFDKYAQAGQDATPGLLDDLNNRLAELPNAAETFAKYMDQGTAAALKNIDAIQSKIDAINGRARNQTEIQRKEAAEAENAAAEVEARTGGMNAASMVSMVNDYQRRVPSLDPSGTSNGAKEIRKDVSQILSPLIRNFQVTREPVF